MTTPAPNSRPSRPWATPGFGTAGGGGLCGVQRQPLCLALLGGISVAAAVAAVWVPALAVLAVAAIAVIIVIRRHRRAQPATATRSRST